MLFLKQRRTEFKDLNYSSQPYVVTPKWHLTSTSSSVVNTVVIVHGSVYGELTLYSDRERESSMVINGNRNLSVESIRSILVDENNRPP